MKQKGKWKILESRKVYQNPWVEIIEENGYRPDGEKGSHILIHYKPGVAVLPIDDEGNVYLNKEYRYAIDKDGIETVAGGIEEGDSPLDTARKELEEELGILAEDWTELGVYNPLTETVLSPSTFFVARKLSFKNQNIEGTEDIVCVKLPLKKARDMVLSGEINFALASLLILFAWEKFGNA